MKILILYDYFDPAYKAGGPIRSLVNLVAVLEKEHEIFILSTDQDHDGTALQVKKDIWTAYGNRSKVKYLSSGNRSYKSIKKEIEGLAPDTVYINGIFSLTFGVYPLLILRNLKNTKIVIAPRGMLQSGALRLKSFKKKVYLFFLKRLIAHHHNLHWHATDEQESGDIKNIFTKARVVIAGNIPVFDYESSSEGSKRVNDFVSISLIAKKKNHLAFIKALKSLELKQPLIYHIYGPKSDTTYFDSILNEIADTKDDILIEYMGVVHPSEVSETLKKYKFYVLTSYGENFGHSIFEAFNNGIPVIISDQTPWKGLYEKKAGWDVDLNEPDALLNAIREAVSMGNETYLEFRKGARKIAEGYMRENDFMGQYRELFDG